MKVASIMVAIAACAHAAQVTFDNARRLLFDADGNQIDAYGSKVNYFNESYYLYGNSFSIKGVAFGIKSYSSADLKNWKYEGFLFDPYGSNPCSQSGGCGRPHILYHANSSTYILWANAGTSGYQIATSRSPTGPFAFFNTTAAIDPQFDGLQPADFTVESFGDKAYLVFSALNFADPRAGSIWAPIFQTLHISALTDDWMNTTLVSYPVASNASDLIDQEAESPDIFYRNGWYYVAASNTCGYCNGSIGLLYRSSSIQGPWTRQILSGYSCDGQVEGVLPLQDPVSGDVTNVWHSTSVPGSINVGWGGHIFQPLVFADDGSAQELDCSLNAKFSVDYRAGSGQNASGALSSARQATPAQAVYTPVCDSDSFELFQTWTVTKSGALESVSINIAAIVQTVPPGLTVFKFDSYSDLVAPEYKWTTLGTASYNATKLSYVYNTASVPITSNATVSVGDLLGIWIDGYDFTPYCHLEYDTGVAIAAAGRGGGRHHDGGDSAIDSTYRLFQRGFGQNSWRGLQGKTSPVYERAGKSVKFFVTYA